MVGYRGLIWNVLLERILIWSAESVQSEENILFREWILDVTIGISGRRFRRAETQGPIASKNCKILARIISLPPRDHDQQQCLVTFDQVVTPARMNQSKLEEKSALALEIHPIKLQNTNIVKIQIQLLFFHSFKDALVFFSSTLFGWL